MSVTLTPTQETARYIDSLGPEALAKAEAYTLGNHALLIAGIGVSLLAAWLMIRFRLLDRVAERLAGQRWALATFAVSAAFFAIGDLLMLPWRVYTDWWREASYGMTKQPLGDFLGQWVLSEAISVVLGALFLLGIYALIRKAGRRWWIWGAGFTAVVTVAMLIATPSLLMPLFNEFKPVPPGEVRTALEQIADDVGIPHERIFMYDGSRQSEYFTANVAGIGPAARIAISDIALKEASLDEVRAVTGHEAGHYKLGHVWRYVIVFPLLAAVLLWLIQRLFAPAARLLGSDATLAEPRGLPVFMVLVSLLSLLSSPVQNGLTRIGEREADAYSLETVGLPDALASALIKTAEYRYPRPAPWQEALFYTHPSVEKRILGAMEWKAAHPRPTASGAPAQP
jgi:STE24 endopeptidase